MNCASVQSALLDLESGNLSEAASTAVRAHLASCPACQREWLAVQETLRALDRCPAEEPTPRLRAGFYAMLDAQIREDAAPLERSDRAPGRPTRWVGIFWPRQTAWQVGIALALLVVGVTLGFSLKPTQRLGEAASASELAATKKELAELRSRVESVNQLVTFSLSQQQSAHVRLQNVVSTLNKSADGESGLAQLLSTLAFDPSTNVRLTALEALYAHGSDAGVRQGVLAALPRESSPLVQVAMIDFLASLRESEAIPAFQQIASTPTTDPAVRTAAQRAIALL